MKKYFLLFVALLSTQLSFSQIKTVDFLITNASIISMEAEIILNNKDIANKLPRGRAHEVLIRNYFFIRSRASRN